MRASERERASTRARESDERMWLGERATLPWRERASARDVAEREKREREREMHMAPGQTLLTRVTVLSAHMYLWVGGTWCCSHPTPFHVTCYVVCVVCAPRDEVVHAVRDAMNTRDRVALAAPRRSRAGWQFMRPGPTRMAYAACEWGCSRRHPGPSPSQSNAAEAPQ